ncbi:hypothetical protein [Acidithiobacillus sp. IBUN Pt1247-S3]|uniref:hypothetical protein n=1 Tax=Acidithiobacillus sp. IBUN Pt1247-S3 TaxID=3166642 RepID=UPI0034E418F2
MVVLLAAILGSSIARASIFIGAPDKGCAYLSRHAISPGAWDTAMKAAIKISQFQGDLYVVSSTAIEKVSHIPDFPNLSSIPKQGDGGQCVAISPSLLARSSRTEGQMWLWLVGIAGTKHKQAYQEAVEAAEHPAIRHIASFFGIGEGLAKQAILSSECQATRWLPQSKKEVAKQEFDQLRPVLNSRWLPAKSAQLKKIEECNAP